MERQTFEDITLESPTLSWHRGHGHCRRPEPGAIGSAGGQSSNTDPAEAATTQTGTRRKVRLSVGNCRRSACVGRAVCRGWHGLWLDTRCPSSNGYLLDGLRARPGRCPSSRRNGQTSPRIGRVALCCGRSTEKRRRVVMKRVVIVIVLVLVIAAATIDCVGFGPGIYGFC